MFRVIKILISIMIVGMLLPSCNQDKIKNTVPMENNGLVIKKSDLDFETTYANLKNLLEANPNLKIILELDHSKNAASKGLKLRPTKIIVFGNPMLGTPLMQSQPTLAIDLPQKVLVYQLENNEVQIAYNNPEYLKERHGAEGVEEVLAKIANALDAITNKAIGK